MLDSGTSSLHFLRDLEIAVSSFSLSARDRLPPILIPKRHAEWSVPWRLYEMTLPWNWESWKWLPN